MLPQQTVEYHLENGRRIAEELARHPSPHDKELRFLVPGTYTDALARFYALTQDPDFPQLLREKRGAGAAQYPPSADPQCFTIECDLSIDSLTDQKFLEKLLGVVRRHDIIFDGWGVPLR